MVQSPWRPLTVALCLLFTACPSSSASSHVVDPPQPVPDIVTAEGPRPFRLSAHRDQVVVVTFGYTSCPDVCPTTLAKLRAVAAALGPRDSDVEMVFVSVDPPRDTRERLESYVSAFDPRFHAVRLEGIALARVLQGFGITVRRNEVDLRRYANRTAAAATYSVDHTGGYFIVDGEGMLRFRAPHDTSVEELSRLVSSLLPHRPQQAFDVRVDSARAQLTPSGVGAVYLRVTNPSGTDDVLVSARTSAADDVQLHEVVPDGQVLRMVHRPDGFALPAGGVLELTPGGKHLMLFGAREDRSIELELVFRHARPVRLQVPAARLAGATP